MTEETQPATLVENMLLLRREDFDDLLDRAAERGAERALAHLGLENGHAAKDIRELRDLLEAWRDARRTAWQTAVKVVTTGILAALLVGAAGLAPIAWVDVALAVTYGALSGYGVLQYGYVRDAYPEALRGRALSLLTMAMFLGVALMQWASGVAASWAPALGVAPFTAALLTMSALLLAGAAAFWRLPRA